MSELIYGINPLTISRVVTRRGKRHGRHPYYTRLRKRKHPILETLFPSQDMFYGWWNPEVRIIGSDGDVLKYIECKSNAEAVLIRDKINERLNAFLSDLKREVK